MNTEIIPAYRHKEEIRALFSEYTSMLTANDPSMQGYLAIQNYEEELSHLEEKYPPGGCIWHATAKRPRAVSA